ncbi:sigma-E processing peptidase SpoIIGA [Metasolibacillus fluoroglycofenilyticus]|uniref:sigma-E processing peptidase SpoIIGA n=1 Tax=Metasolibacillus fluoroglycofenilyticus TaxID=1239396 RepID=UPI000D3442D0|nr:sigma-E processing peptidase SpoIIGA [Metasolibacillus fluoroglycofenilyticus]
MVGEWLVLINTLFNYLLVLFISKITNVYVTKKRALVAAFISGTFSAIFTPSLFIGVISALLLAGIAFSFRYRILLKQIAVLVVATIFLGGLLTAVQPFLAGRSLFFYITLCSLLAIFSSKWAEIKWRDFWQQKIQASYVVTCKLHLGDTELQLRGFIDTGNMCTEPISQQPVHFISYRMIKDKLPATINDAINSWDAAAPYNLSMFPREWLTSIRLIPLTTVQHKAIVPAFRLTEWTINEEKVTGHYVVLTKNDANFPQQADMMLHVLALSNQQ